MSDEHSYPPMDVTMVVLSPLDAERLDNIQKSLDAILRELTRQASQGVPVGQGADFLRDSLAAIHKACP